MRQTFNEGIYIVGWAERVASTVPKRRIESIKTVLSSKSFEVVELALARETDPFSRQDITSDYGLRVVLGDSSVGRS